MYFSVVRDWVFKRAGVSIIDHIEDERGVVKEIVLDARFVDGL